MTELTEFTGIVHGDVKPENILIFKNSEGRLIAKLADFGCSVLGTSRDQLVRLPKSEPWFAPEYHHRDFKLYMARRMDIYSFGMLCLWILSSNDNEILVLLDKWKREDKIRDEARRVTESLVDLGAISKIGLQKFFDLVLVAEPERRSSELRELIGYLIADRYK